MFNSQVRASAVILNLGGTKLEALYLVALFLQLTLAGILFIQFAGEFARCGRSHKK